MSGLNKTIYLTGFMGAGKSTVGKLLAQKLGVGFVDLDDYIEETSNKKIPHIFKEHGEAHFRKLETQALIDVSRKSIVISTGGGVVETKESQRIMKETGMIFFLDAPFPVLYERIFGDPNRPLAALKKDDLQKRFERRKPLYERGAITIHTHGCSPYEVVQRILLDLTD
ncbi:shikimate kinase [Alteribacter aurantiacus]|uniref:shikimate kinase n=1 Tax=Alteribacter aurantiacus TaxID=254410 RepID=UPI00040EF612|nr:shikimate kinase [Alteribacter aurantiacus]